MVEMKLSGQYGTPAVSIVHSVLEWWQCVGSRHTQYRFQCTINTSQCLASTSLQTFQLHLLNAVSHQVLDNMMAHPTAQLGPLFYFIFVMQFSVLRPSLCYMIL